MKNFSLSSLFIPLAAALAIYFPLSNAVPISDPKPAATEQQRSENSPQSSKSQSNSNQSNEVFVGEGARLLCDFFGQYQTGGESQLNTNSPGLKGDYCSLKNVVIKTRNDLKSLQPNQQLNLDFVLATVADPKDSQLDHLFDRNLDAIQRAVEASGYVLDRYYLPWEKKSSPTETSTTATASGGALTVTNKQTSSTSSTRHIYEPGVLVFRRTNTRDENDAISLLAVFLVGETPTFGIQKLAFQNALTQIDQLSKLQNLTGSRLRNSSPCPKIEGNHLRILGPTFSGSATSLALSLKTWLDRPKPSNALSKACVISGTATTILKELFVQRAGGQGNVDFFSTMVPDAEARAAFYQYLATENRPLILGKGARFLPLGPAKDSDRIYIASLSEANTSYGRAASRPTPRPTPTPKESLLTGPLTNTSTTPTPVPSVTPPSLSLTFPLHISQLRIEAAKVKTVRPDMSNGLSLKEGNLALPMGSEQNPKDILPTFSTMEAVTSELALSDVLGTIHREGVRYVGLTATDVLDRMFLIREIREHCPNVVIFTFSSDLIYQHSDANLDAQGLLVITPYPLFTQNQSWTYPFEGEKSRQLFSTQSGQGVYNATLALLGEPDLLLEYGDPFTQYDVGKNHKPALWLGVVGRNGIWPIKTLPYNNDRGFVWEARVPQHSPTKQLHPGTIRRSQSVISLNFLLLMAFLCLTPSAALVAQLLLFSMDREDKAAAQESAAQPGLFKRLWRGGLRFIRNLIGKLGLLRLARKFKRGRIGQIFGDEEFYQYRFIRRIYLMACCVSLLTISLFAALLSLIPQRIKEFSNGWWQDWVITGLSWVVLIWVAVAYTWLLISILHWMFNSKRNLIGAEQAIVSLLTGFLMIGLIAFGFYEVFAYKPNYAKALFFLRTTEITNGVSLLTPMACIGLAAFLTFYSAVRRINLAERMACLPHPRQKITKTPSFLRFDHVLTKSFDGVNSLENRLRELIVGRGFSIKLALLITSTGFFLYGLLFLTTYTPSVDGWRFDLFFLVVFCVVPLLLICAFIRFVWTWIALRKLLRRLSWHPLFADFVAAHSEEKRFSLLPTIDPLSPPPTYTALSLSVQQVRRFYNALEMPAGKHKALVKIRHWIEKAEQSLTTAIQFEAHNNWQEAMLNRRSCEAMMAKLSGRISALLERGWKLGGNKDDAEKNDWQDEGKFFLVMHVAAFLQHVFAHLQNLVVLTTGGMLLVLMASNSYSFQPRQPLLIFSWVTILTVVIVTLLIFVQMSRDKVLSLLSGTTPGKLNVTRDFVVRVLIHGVIPIIALLGAQFPETLRQIFSWLSALQGNGH